MNLFKYILPLILWTTPAFAADVSSLMLGGRMTRAATVTEFNLNASTFPLDATTDAYGAFMQMDEVATITQVCWANGFRTGTAPTYRASLQALATTGFNTGTVLGGGSPASCTFANAAYAGDGTTQCCTLANSYTTAQGEALTVHIDYSSGTINASNNIEFAYGLVGSDSASLTAFPYTYLTTAGTPAKASAGRYPVVFMKSASKTYGYPGTDIEVTAYSSDSTPDEYGLAFTVPSSMCNTYKVSGITCLVRRAAAAKTMDIVLYSGTTNLQDIQNFDTDGFSGAGSAGERSYAELLFNTTLATLSCGTSYTIAFSFNADTAVNFGLASLDVQTAAELSAMPGGTTWFQRTRTNAGAWTDVTDKRPFCDIILKDVTAPSGGGELFPGSFMNWGIN